MKVIHKFFVIALLLSIVFTMSAVAAAENATFEQGNIGEVSTETLSVSSENQEIETVEEESSVNDAEDQLQASNEDDELTANGGTFADLQSEIDRTVNGGTIYLNGKTYYATENKPIKINKTLTIIGGSSLNEDDCAVLEARGLGKILTISGRIGNEITVTLKSIIFQNGNSKSSYEYGGAISSSANLYVHNCYFLNNSAYSGGAISSAGSVSYDPSYNGYYYGSYHYYCESYWTNNYTNWTNYYKNKYGKGLYEVLYPDYTIEFINCTFEKNKATSRVGGAMNINEGPGYGYAEKYLLIKNCTFVNNTADDDGGAIYGGYYGYYYEQEQGIVNCTFIDNHADDGGAIYSHSIATKNSTFIRNTATKGGAIYGISSISNSKFEDNSASYGGAIYVNWGSSILNNNFINNQALNMSSAMYFNDANVKLKGNVIEGEKCEIFVNNKEYDGFSGLNIVILDNTTVQFCEGKIKIYALVTDDMENKVASENFTFLVGEKEFTTILRDSIAEIEYNAKLSDSGTIVSYKPQKYDKTANIYNGKLDIIPFSVVIEFEDVTGVAGRTIQVPVYVHDASGHPLEGKIKVYYNGNDYTVPFTNGKKDVTVSLPTDLTTFDLTIEYENVFKTHKVTVIEAPTVEAVIDVPASEHGYVGSTVTIPVSVHDTDGNPLEGVITVSYNGQEKTLNLINGEIDVLIGLPVYETSFDVSISYYGKSATCHVTVTKPVVETVANVIIPHNVSGEIGKSLTVPVNITDKDDNPLSGDIIVSYNGNEKTIPFTNGQASISITLPQHETSFELIVEYKGNIAKCLVEAIDPTNHTDVVINVGEKVTGNTGASKVIPVTVTDSKGNALKGNVTVHYNGQEKTFNLVNGVANVIISLPAIESTFDLIISYNGHVAITSVEAINPKPHTIVPVINLPANKTVEIGKTIIIPVEIHDADGNPLDGEIIVFYNNQEKSLAFTNGTANIIIGSQPAAVSFEVTVSYEGIMKHCNVEVIDNTPVVEPAVIITLPQNESGHAGHSIIVPVSVFDENGNPLQGDIYAFYNGHEVTEALHNGQANIILELPENQTSFNLRVMYNDKTADCLINVLEKSVEHETNDTTVIIELEQDITGNIGKNIMVPVSVHDEKGNALQGDILVIYNGHDRKVALRNGIANVLIGLPVHASTFELTVEYEGIFKTTTVHAVDPNNALGNLTEAEANKDGSVVIDFPKDAKGDVIINIGGKNYTGKIVDGKVELDVNDLPNGNYESTIIYNGDGNYSGFTRTIMIVVKESKVVDNKPNTPVKPPAVVKKASKITAKKKTFKAKKKVKKYSITLKSGKTPLKKVQVTIKVGKKTYKAKTNAKGKATFKINKLTKKGKYTAVIKFKGNKTYKAATKKVKITVK